MVLPVTIANALSASEERRFATSGRLTPNARLFEQPGEIKVPAVVRLDHLEHRSGLTRRRNTSPPVARCQQQSPGRHAGNLDNRELVAGSTLFIPIFVRGALFEIGDGHAAQGDGEVSQTAIETSLRGRVQLTVRKDMKLTWPRAETAVDYISMGTDEDLKVATTIAIQEMVDFLSSTRELSKHEAYQLVSIAGHVAITQLVDRPVYGVHVRMPKSIFKGK